MVSDSFLESDKVKSICIDVMNKAKIFKSPNSFLSSYGNYEITKVVRKYKPSYGESTSRNGKKVKSLGFYNMMVMKMNTSEGILDICEHMESFEEIEYAEPNYSIQLDNRPNDPQYFRQDGFEDSTDRDIDAERAWDFTTGNSGIKVGVIDNGVDYDNIDLGGGRFNVPGAKVRGGFDYLNNDSDPDYTEDVAQSHGTECAGIIAELRNNGVGIAGLAGGRWEWRIRSTNICIKSWVYSM